MALPNSPFSLDEIADTLETARPRLKEILRRHRIPPEDAEDLLQETFVITLAKWPEIQNKQAWLAATLRNRCLMYWRARRSPHALELTELADLELLAPPREPLQCRSTTPATSRSSSLSCRPASASPWCCAAGSS